MAAQKQSVGSDAPGRVRPAGTTGAEPMMMRDPGGAFRMVSSAANVCP